MYDIREIVQEIDHDLARGCIEVLQARDKMGTDFIFHTKMIDGRWKLDPEFDIDTHNKESYRVIERKLKRLRRKMERNLDLIDEMIDNLGTMYV